MIILGAGLSGLICGALNAQATIYERNPKSFTEHRAVLRFRDDKIARALGLTFRKVTVRKAIWFDGQECQPSPRLANWYSTKVRGVITENSLWNIAPSERFIAPDDLHGILADICGPRVTWSHEITESTIRITSSSRHPLISTIPLPSLLKFLSIESPIAFRYSPIYVTRYTVPDCDVYQTMYYPGNGVGVYRATLTGPLLTVESTHPSTDQDRAIEDETMVVNSFGLNPWHVLDDKVRNHKQSFGKIAPIDNGVRKALLHALTTEWGIYSLGRFATWRNILLDDVYEDINVIRRMMTQSTYDANLERTKL